MQIDSIQFKYPDEKYADPHRTSLFAYGFSIFVFLLDLWTRTVFSHAKGSTAAWSSASRESANAWQCATLRGAGDVSLRHREFRNYAQFTRGICQIESAATIYNWKPSARGQLLCQRRFLEPAVYRGFAKWINRRADGARVLFLPARADTRKSQTAACWVLRFLRLRLRLSRNCRCRCNAFALLPPRRSVPGIMHFRHPQTFT